MQATILKLKNANPEFTHHFFDQVTGGIFIGENFGLETLKSYLYLKPSSYKADLLRFCALYKLGGIYIDVKYTIAENFSLIQLTNEEHWYDTGFTGVMVSKAGSIVLRRAITQIVHNVKTRNYGNHVLDPTGPFLLRRAFGNSSLNLDLYFKLVGSRHTIVWHNRTILEEYETYRTEQSLNQDTAHYSVMWYKKDIFNSHLNVTTFLSQSKKLSNLYESLKHHRSMQGLATLTRKSFNLLPSFW